MASREALHRLIEELPADPLLAALDAAPPDDEPDDDFDGGLTEARADAEAGRGITTAELRERLRPR